MKTRIAILSLLLPLALFAQPASAADDPPATYAGDNDVYDGDILKLYTNVGDFTEIGDVSETKFCAPKGSVLAVTSDRNDLLSVRFKKVPAGKVDALLEETPSPEAVGKCTSTSQIVNDYTQYEIGKGVLLRHSFRRSGITFGALVVPFKFYLSGDRKITTSSTIAPYIGFRLPQSFSLTVTPIVSAGLGLVPVADPNSGETETKSALTVGFGFALKSTKNDAFNAGFLIGRDFLSRSDEKADPNVRKAWFSLYVGYKL
jgi:hypothetical protein